MARAPAPPSKANASSSPAAATSCSTTTSKRGHSGQEQNHPPRHIQPPNEGHGMGPLAFRQTKPLRPAISAGTIQLPTTLDARPRRSAILIPDQLPANKGGHGRL